MSTSRQAGTLDKTVRTLSLRDFRLVSYLTVCLWSPAVLLEALLAPGLLMRRENALLFVTGRLFLVRSCLCVRMVSERFRQDVATVPGLVAVALAAGTGGLALTTLSISLVTIALMVGIGLWIVYLLYRLVVAVEAVAAQTA